MRHTIVIEIPDSYERNVAWVEDTFTRALEARFCAKVIQYHHEQIPEDCESYRVEQHRDSFVIRNMATGALVKDGIMPVMRSSREAAEREAEALSKATYAEGPDGEDYNDVYHPLEGT